MRNRLYSYFLCFGLVVGLTESLLNQNMLRWSPLGVKIGLNDSALLSGLSETDFKLDSDFLKENLRFGLALNSNDSSMTLKRQQDYKTRFSESFSIIGDFGSWDISDNYDRIYAVYSGMRQGKRFEEIILLLRRAESIFLFRTDITALGSLNELISLGNMDYLHIGQSVFKLDVSSKAIESFCITEKTDHISDIERVGSCVWCLNTNGILRFDEKGMKTQIPVEGLSDGVSALIHDNFLYVLSRKDEAKNLKRDSKSWVYILSKYSLNCVSLAPTLKQKFSLNAENEKETKKSAYYNKLAGIPIQSICDGCTIYFSNGENYSLNKLD